jgi:hypothetical protein
MLRILSIVLCLAVFAGNHRGAAQDALTLEAEAPPNHAVLRHVRGGAFFVAKDLKQKYDELLARVERLKVDVAAGRVAGEAALRDLAELEPQLDKLRDDIEAGKVLVSPLQVQQQTEEALFTLGPEQRLVITADNLHVVGWDGPQVKCVLEKTLLSVGHAPEVAEFASLKLVHRHGEASDLVGRPAEEVAAEERAYLAEQRDTALTEAQLASRREFVESIQAGFAPFQDFQGKEVDVLSIDGLTHQQGNRQVVVDINSQGGEGMGGSDWRRHARLTVFVPKCRGVILRGCLKGVAVEKLNAPLIATDAGSQDRDYDAKSSIVDVAGPVAIFNVPINRLEGVRGDVKIVATLEYANSGTRHGNGKRIAYTPAPRECSIADVEGNLSAWFSRVNLKAAGIQGQIDVRNEAGDTVLTLDESPAKQAHRVLSESGRVEVQTAQGAVAELPVMALTTEGSVETNADQRAFEDVNFTTGTTIDGSRRGWRGFVSPSGDGLDRFMMFERPGRVLRGVETEPGLTLISRSGVTALVVN